MNSSGNESYGYSCLSWAVFSSLLNSFSVSFHALFPGFLLLSHRVGCEFAYLAHGSFLSIMDALSKGCTRRAPVSLAPPSLSAHSGQAAVGVLGPPSPPLSVPGGRGKLIWVFAQSWKET